MSLGRPVHQLLNELDAVGLPGEQDHTLKYITKQDERGCPY